MYNIIIFSKDRGCQLDLLLRSIKEFFIGYHKYTFNILYKYSSDSFEHGYNRVKMLHPEFNYIEERHFKSDVINHLSYDRLYTMFGVDDDVFKEPFDPECKEVKLLDTEENLACLSLRMHPHIRYCYTENRDTPAPAHFINTDPYIWDCSEQYILDNSNKLLGDWSYKMSIDFSIFITKDIIEKCSILNYSNPNSFEGTLAVQPIYRPWMACFEKSKIINIPANKVQTVNGNRCGTTTAETLNTMFLNGFHIALAPIKGFHNISAHQDIALTLTQQL
jgi:hypothetical protein